ncbi:hypothetical protein A5622_14745 [Mycobacterium sp. 1245801.1]|nr:hypothetical protein A5622_14745 [Mycobacterium sp. 1245801.1]
MDSHGYVRTQRWEIIADRRVAQLHHRFRPRQITQVLRPQIHQPGTVGKPIEDQLGGRPGQHCLAAMRQITQAHRSIDGVSGMICCTTQLHLTGVHTDA